MTSVKVERKRQKVGGKKTKLVANRENKDAETTSMDLLIAAARTDAKVILDAERKLMDIAKLDQRLRSQDSILSEDPTLLVLKSEMSLAVEEHWRTEWKLAMMAVVNSIQSKRELKEVRSDALTDSQLSSSNALATAWKIEKTLVTFRGTSGGVVTVIFQDQLPPFWYFNLRRDYQVGTISYFIGLRNFFNCNIVPLNLWVTVFEKLYQHFGNKFVKFEIYGVVPQNIPLPCNQVWVFAKHFNPALLSRPSQGASRFKEFKGEPDQWIEFTTSGLDTHILDRAGKPVWQWESNELARYRVVQQQMESVIAAMFPTSVVDNAKRVAAKLIVENAHHLVPRKFGELDVQNGKQTLDSIPPSTSRIVTSIAIRGQPTTLPNPLDLPNPLGLPSHRSQLFLDIVWESNHHLANVTPKLFRKSFAAPLNESSTSEILDAIGMEFISKHLATKELLNLDIDELARLLEWIVCCSYEMEIKFAEFAETNFVPEPDDHCTNFGDFGDFKNNKLGKFGDFTVIRSLRNFYAVPTELQQLFTADDDNWDWHTLMKMTTPIPSALVTLISTYLPLHCPSPKVYAGQK